MLELHCLSKSVSIQRRFLSPLTGQTSVKLEDFRRAKPDAIAHSTAKIIARVKLVEIERHFPLNNYIGDVRAFKWRYLISVLQNGFHHNGLIIPLFQLKGLLGIY